MKILEGGGFVVQKHGLSNQAVDMNLGPDLTSYLILRLE